MSYSKFYDDYKWNFTKFMNNSNSILRHKQQHLFYTMDITVFTKFMHANYCVVLRIVILFAWSTFDSAPAAASALCLDDNWIYMCL